MSIVADAASVTGTIAPVTPDQRRLTGLDLAVLWGDLGVGLLVLVAARDDGQRRAGDLRPTCRAK